jgi:hypothetical protein
MDDLSLPSFRGARRVRGGERGLLPLTRGVLRSLLKNLMAFQSLYESEGVDVVCGPDGDSYSLYDIEYLYSARVLLSSRQRQAIELFLVKNMKEKEVALVMGVSESNPVASYASQGIDKILGLVANGGLPRYRPEGNQGGSTALRGPRPAGRRGDGVDQEVAGGCDLDVREIGHLDSVEGSRPAAPGGLHGDRGARRILATWHVSPGMEFAPPASEQRERPGTGTRRPPRWSVRTQVRA